MVASSRAGSGDDVERCVELWSRLIVARDGPDVASEVARRARATFTQPVVRFAVAGSAPDGFALTVTKKPHFAHLARISVDPSVSSYGLGTALIADAIEHSRADGFACLDLEVRMTNSRAIALYDRAEFTVASPPGTTTEESLS